MNILGRREVTLRMFIDELPPITRKCALWGTYLNVPSRLIEARHIPTNLYTGSSAATRSNGEVYGIASRVNQHQSIASRTFASISKSDQKYAHYKCITARNVNCHFRALSL